MIEHERVPHKLGLSEQRISRGDVSKAGLVLAPAGIDHVVRGIEEIRSHPFTFGFETALKSRDCCIVPDPASDFQKYKMVYTPSVLTDSHWYGDCAVDSSLTFNALAMLRGIENLRVFELSIPSVSGLEVKHVQVKCDDPDLTIDHSNFYSRLKSTSRSEITIHPNSPFGIAWELPLGNEGKGYKEFDYDGKQYVINFFIEKPSTTFQLNPGSDSRTVIVEIQLLEQEDGEITRALSIEVESEISLELNPRDLNASLLRDHYSNFSTAYLATSKNNGIDIIKFEEGKLKEEMIQALVHVLRAVRVGCDVAEARKRTETQRCRALRDPFGWWLG